MRARPKRYDQAYFDRWYRDPERRVRRPAELARQVAFALAAAELRLGRRLRSCLDLGCGEGEWGLLLRRRRPGLRYLGVDSSDYAVARYGRRRHLVAGRFEELGRLRLGRPFDLVVAHDLFHYLAPRELDLGLAVLPRLVGGVAWLDFCTREDAVEGDRLGLLLRRRAWYERRFSAVGLVALGSSLYAPRR